MFVSSENMLLRNLLSKILPISLIQITQSKGYTTESWDKPNINSTESDIFYLF